MLARNGCVFLVMMMLLGGCMKPNADQQATPGKEVRTRNENAAGINVQLGIAYYQQGDMERAKRKLLLAERQDPHSYLVMDAMAYFLEMTGEPQQAEQYYLRGIAVAPGNGSALNNYGGFLCRAHQFKKAEQYFLQAVEDTNYLSPAEVYENAGLCALSAHELRRAELYFIKALQKQPQLANSLLEMGRISYNKQDYFMAKKYLEKFSQHAKPTADSLVLAVRIGQKTNDSEWVASNMAVLKSKFAKSKEYQEYLAEEKDEKR